MLQANRIVSLALTIVFVISTTHLIVHRPMYSSVIRDKNKEIDATRAIGRRDLLKLTPGNKKVDISVNAKTTTNYVIFDASQYSGNLAFLDEERKGWRILVINLKNISQLMTCKSCFLLKDDWIKTNVVDKWRVSDEKLEIDSNGLARLASYAYALSHGAPWIYTTDRPVPIPYGSLKRVTIHEVKTGTVYQGPNKVFEPCNHFMDPFTWTGRGFHLAQGRYNVKVVSSHSIYQVVNECIKNGMASKNWMNYMDTRAPIPYIMPGTYAAIDFNNVLASNQNAWTLIASVFQRSEDNPSVSPKALQINMMVQRVLWDTPSAIGFVPHKSNAGHSYHCPTCSLEAQMNNVGNKLRSNLTNWRCDFFEPVPKCLVRLSQQDFITDRGLQSLISLWVSILESYGWNSIQRTVFSEERINERFSGIPVYFSPAKSLHSNSSSDTRPPNTFRDLCGKDQKQYQAEIPEQHVFENIILIIVFNFGAFVSNIPILEYVYGRHFKHTIYCSDSVEQFEKRYQKHFSINPVSFVEVKHLTGYWAQSCMTATMKMGYDAIGYLQLSDDVLLNAWNLNRLPFDKPWFQSSIRVANIHSMLVPDIWINQFWWPWTQTTGKKSSVNTYNQLHAMISNPSDGDRVSHFLENLHKITNCNHCFMYEASDIFYVPSSLISNFTFFSDIFFHNGVFLEIAIPTILVGITSDADVYRLRGNYLWFQDREKYPVVYTEYDHFYHAMKLSQLSVKKHLNFYCNNFLDKLDKDVMRKRT